MIFMVQPVQPFRGMGFALLNPMRGVAGEILEGGVVGSRGGFLVGMIHFQLVIRGDLVLSLAAADFIILGQPSLEPAGDGAFGRLLLLLLFLRSLLFPLLFLFLLLGFLGFLCLLEHVAFGLAVELQAQDIGIRDQDFRFMPVREAKGELAEAVLAALVRRAVHVLELGAHGHHFVKEPLHHAQVLRLAVSRRDLGIRGVFAGVEDRAFGVVFPFSFPLSFSFPFPCLFLRLLDFLAVEFQAHDGRVRIEALLVPVLELDREMAEPVLVLRVRAVDMLEHGAHGDHVVEGLLRRAQLRQFLLPLLRGFELGRDRGSGFRLLLGLRGRRRVQGFLFDLVQLHAVGQFVLGPRLGVFRVEVRFEELPLFGLFHRQLGFPIGSDVRAGLGPVHFRRDGVAHAVWVLGGFPARVVHGVRAALVVRRGALGLGADEIVQLQRGGFGSLCLFGGEGGG